MVLFARSSLPDDARRSLRLARRTRCSLLRSSSTAPGPRPPVRSWRRRATAVTHGRGATSTARATTRPPRRSRSRGSTARPLVLRLADVRRTSLAQTVRERVQSSVVLAEVVPLGEGRSAKVAVRRDTDGSLFSQVVADSDVDLDDPRTRAAIDAAEDRVRSMSGLPL
ncbi:hypothetical protein NKG05_25340 [Oerskovia sp. M15]